jgi:predicted RNA binding protein YcfA (HicA-like mRNA interferase family)
LKVRDVIKKIEDHGWKLARTRGSHRQFHSSNESWNSDNRWYPSAEIPPGTLNSILKQAGLK